MAGVCVGFVPAGSYTWGSPSRRARPRSWPWHSLVLALAVLLHFHCPVSPHAPRPRTDPAAAAGTGHRGTPGGTYGAAAAPVGELRAALAGVPEQGPSSRCRLINLGQIDELAACWVGVPQPLSGECSRPWGLLQDGPPISLLTCGLEERGFGEEEELLLLQDEMLPPILPCSGPRAPPCQGSLPANPQAGMRHLWAPQNLKVGSNRHLLVLLAWLCSPGESQLNY